MAAMFRDGAPSSLLVLDGAAGVVMMPGPQPSLSSRCRRAEPDPVITETERPARDVRVHAAELLTLAAPVIVSRTGLMIMTTVDAAIVGRYSADELAHYGLGHLPAGMMAATAVGLLLGTVALTAHAVGAGEPQECGRVFRRSLPYALLVGTLLAVLCLFGEPLFLAAGQTPDLAAGGGRVLATLAAGFPAMALFIVASFFLEGLKRPLPGMVVMILGNLLNALLNLLLVWGLWGLPELGAVGSALATTLVRWAMALALLAYIWWLNDRDRWGIRGSFRGVWREGARQRRFGYAAGLSLAFESVSFAVLGFFAGWISPLALGAYTIALNLLAVPFMAAAGIAAATAVRVGVGYGRGDAREVALAGWTGLAVSSVILTAVAGLYLGVPGWFAAIYTADPVLHALVMPLIALSAWALVADGGQVVMANALRGRNDVWVPTVLHFVSYGAVMIPTSAALAFWFDRGPRGLIEGILVASIVSVGVLAARFAWLTRRQPAGSPLFAHAKAGKKLV